MTIEGAARFEGSVPAFYDRFLGGFLFEPYAAEIARRLPAGPDARVLEIACGTGILTRHLRRRLPAGAELVATDLNEPMIDFARGKLAGESIHWRTADAQELPFKAGVFDAVVCAFGLMFLPDKPAGFREAHRVLRPGGTFLATTWSALHEHAYASIAAETLARLFPDDPPRFYEVPHGLHDVAALERMARDAGFETVSVERVVLEGHAPSARHLATGLTRGTPMAALLAERGAEWEAVIHAVSKALRDGEGALPYSSPLPALVITAS